MPKSQLNFFYDRRADVLYVSKGHPAFTDYEELSDNVILRTDPETKDVVGFTIMDFVRRFAQERPALRVPLTAKFQRVKAVRKPRIVAESRQRYRVKRKGASR